MNRLLSKAAFEALEERILMSTWTVSNPASSGSGSFPDAVQQADAAGGDQTIVFDSSLTSQSSAEINLQGINLSIEPVSGTVTIQGSSGPNTITLDLNHSGSITVNGQCVIDDLTVENGSDSGIINNGNLTVNDSVISDNSTSGSGGGIFSEGDLILNDSTVTGNTASQYGGGISSSGYLAINDSTISENQASGPAGSGTGEAGGIFDSGQARITQTTISDNSSYVAGGIANSGDLTIAESTLSGNATAGYGGAVENFGELSVDKTTFYNNYGEIGGAIYNSLPGQLTITSSTFTANMSEVPGGAIFNVGQATVTDSTITGNTAFGFGGGIANYGSAMALYGTIIAGNIGIAGDEGDLQGSFTGTNNLIGDGSGGLTDPSNIQPATGENPIDPMLAPLGYYGGPTQTMPPLPGSPAIGAGALFLGPTHNLINIDQRGFSVLNTTPDIGAFQTQSNPLEVNSTDDGSDGLGQLSLRDAVNLGDALGGNQTITFDPALTAFGSAAITLSAGDLDLDDTTGTLTIDGSGGNYPITLNGSNSQCVVVPNSNASFSSITFNCAIDDEGTIFVDSPSGSPAFIDDVTGNGSMVCDSNVDLSGMSFNGNVQIASGVTADITSDTLINSGLQIDSGGDLEITGGTFSGSLQNDGTVNINGGNILFGNGNYANDDGTINIANGTYEVASGAIVGENGDSSINLNAGGAIQVDNGGQAYFGGATNLNGGLLQIDGSFTQSLGSFQMNGGAINVAGGSLSFSSGAAAVENGTVDITNGGSLTVSSSSSLSLYDGSSMAEDNTGDVEIDGPMNLSGGSNFNCAGGVVNDTGSLTVDDSTLNFSGSYSLGLENGGSLSFTDGSSSNLSGGTLESDGSLLIDDSSVGVSSGTVEFDADSTESIQDDGKLFFNGGTLSNSGTLSIDSGGSLLTAPLSPGAVNVQSGGVVTIAAGSDLTGTLTVSPGGTLINDSTLDLTTALSSGQLVLDDGSNLVNQGTVIAAGSLALGLVNFQNQGTLDLDDDGSITGGGTFTPPTTTPYSYSIDGGTVSGTDTESGSDTYSYDYTPDSQTYSDDDTDTTSYSDSGSSSYPADGGTDTGSSTDSGDSSYSEQCSTSASLVNGVWVWSGSDSGVSSDYGTSTYSDNGTYVEYVDGFCVTGTTTSIGRSNSSNNSNWSMTLNTDGTWSVNFDNNTSFGGDDSNYSYNGGDSYNNSVSGISSSGSTVESGSDVESNDYNTSCNFSNGVYVYGGTSTGTWVDSSEWTESFNGSFGMSIGSESFDYSADENIGENTTSDGALGSTLNADGTWSLTSGSSSDTDHNFDNGGDEIDASYSSSTSDAELSAEDSYGYTDDNTVNGNASSGVWVYTGSGSTHSDDSGDSTLDAGQDYTNPSGIFTGLVAAGWEDQTYQQSYSDTFDTNSTIAANGTVSNTGSGSSYQSNSSDFSFNGSGTATYVFPSGAPNQFGDTTSSVGTVIFTENGMQDQSTDLTTSWVLDPNGNWRAANEQDVEMGETGCNSQCTYVVSANFSDGTKFVGRSVVQFQTDYTYNDHINVATDANGVKTTTGTGSGTGSLNSLGGYQSTGIPGNPSWGQAYHQSWTMGDNWTQNYSQNTLSLSSGSLSNVSYWDSSGDTTPMTCYLGQMSSTAMSFNTVGLPNYGQIGSPTVTSVVSFTPVPNYGTVVPSDPNNDYKPPSWESAAVWTCRGVAAVSIIAAGAFVAAGYPIFGAAAASGAATTSGSLAVEAVATAEAQAVGSAFGVIGSYPGYIAVAEQLGAVYFNLSATLYEAAGVVANQAFIRAAIGLGVTFILSSDPEYAGEGLQMEIDMLKAAGYIFTQTGWGTTLTPPGAP
jgi:hypothetical protein